MRMIILVVFIYDSDSIRVIGVSSDLYLQNCMGENVTIW